MDAETMESLGLLDPRLTEVPDDQIDPALTAASHTEAPPTEENYTALYV